MIIIVIIIAALILVNGFFAASEMALVSLSPRDIHTIKQQGSKRANMLDYITSDSTRYLSTIQVAITFAGFLSSAFAGNTFADYFVTLAAQIGLIIPTNIMVVIITFILSFLTLVLGELVPKRIALLSPKRFALLSAPIIRVTMVLFRPFVWLLTISTKAVLKLFGLSTSSKQKPLTEQDIKEWIVYGHLVGLYPSLETKMMQRIFTFDDLTVDMVMTRKNDVIALDINNVDETHLTTVIDSQYSRIPVYESELSNIVGVLLLKDLFVELEDKDINKVNVRSLLRQPLIVSPTLPINVLLQEMKTSKQHLAFITDDNNNLLGIITLEDIVEEIFGDIYDEHDQIDPKEHSGLSYIVDGSMTIDELNRKLNISIPSSAETTINTYVSQHLETKNKNTIELKEGTIQFDVLSKEKEDITQLKCTIVRKAHFPT